jgi:hypothetical protein
MRKFVTFVTAVFACVGASTIGLGAGLMLAPVVGETVIPVSWALGTFLGAAHLVKVVRDYKEVP